MKRSVRRICMFAAIIALGWIPSVYAARLDPATILKGSPGPVTPYGETPNEVAAKRVMFLWTYTSMVERKPQEAFDRYVSKEYCNHSHLSTRGLKECGSYQETLERWLKNYSSPLPPGHTVEYPALASVDGEMVTMYGAGVDIFRVKDGKITDHWDASPPAQVSIKAHLPEFTQWVLGPRQGPPPMPAADPRGGVLIDQQKIDSVDVGPPTPYGETSAEAAAKALVFKWVHQAMVQGRTREAYEQFVSRNYCDHSHMLTRGLKPCGTYEEAIAIFEPMDKPRHVGERMEIPTMASVNGEMVTMYGAGVDIFRVHDGKITDHWDASPPAAVTIAAHAPGFAEWVQGDRKGPPPMLQGDPR